MELLRKKVSRCIRENALFLPGDTLVVAFSGGADSAALLDVLANLQEYNLHLVLAHLNHLLRGAESNADERFARGIARQYRCPFVLSRVDVARVAMEKGLSLEEAGREVRYTFLHEVAVKHGATAVAVAHHKGDQAETVLMRLMRGAAGSGLSGMRPKSPDGKVVRPLLCVSRPEIEAYLRTGGLSWREDSSNAVLDFLRNRIRHELLPYLEQIAPDMESRLCQTAEVLAADEDYLESAAAGVSARSVTVSSSGAEIALDIFCKEPRAMRMRVYRQAIAAVTGNVRHIAFAHLVALDRLISADKPNSGLLLPGGIRAVRAYRTLLITTRPEEPLPGDVEMKLAGPGQYLLPCGGSLLVEVLDSPAAAERTVGPDVFAAGVTQLQFPLTVRYYRNADRFVPAGMTGRKKLKDLFVDRKIPLQARRRIPLLVADGEIIWVCGVQLSVKAKAASAGSSLPWCAITYTAAAGRY